MGDLVFRLPRNEIGLRRRVTRIFALLLSGGENSGDNLPLGAVACEVAFLLAEKACALHPRLSLWLLRAAGLIVRFGRILAPSLPSNFAPERASASLALHTVGGRSGPTSLFLLEALLISALFGQGGVSNGSREILVRHRHVLGISQQAKVEISGDVFVQDNLALGLCGPCFVREAVALANKLVDVHVLIGRVVLELAQLLASLGTLIFVVVHSGEGRDHLCRILEWDLPGAVACLQQVVGWAVGQREN